MKCYICKKIFEYKGGFLLSPPIGHSDDQLCSKSDLSQTVIWIYGNVLMNKINFSKILEKEPRNEF